jgi:hypothetical protein
VPCRGRFDHESHFKIVENTLHRLHSYFIWSIYDPLPMRVCQISIFGMPYFIDTKNGLVDIRYGNTAAEKKTEQ